MLRWWLLVAISVTITHAQQTCDNIEGNYTLLDGNFPDKCKQPNHFILGNTKKYAILDFSKASEKTINDFLGQKTTVGQRITTISGSIIMVENPKVESINFGEINDVDGREVPEKEALIEICGNPNLKTIINSTRVDIRASKKAELTVSVYNNLNLDKASCNFFKEAIKENALNDAAVKLHIQNGPNECVFQHPFKDDIYWKPDDKWLKQCKTIRGDFIMESGSLDHGIKFFPEPACLRLMGVNMQGFHLTGGPYGRGIMDCKNGQKSEIVDNLNLCGDKMQSVINYFKPDINVTIRVDASCTITCAHQNQVDHIYHICSSISVSASLNDWFSRQGHETEQKQLKTATVLTINGTGASIISLPHLAQVDELYISENTQLKEISLPRLRTMKKLSIHKNAVLTSLNLGNLMNMDELELVENAQLEKIIVDKKITIKLKRLTITGNSLTFDQIQDLPFSIPVDFQSHVVCKMASETVSSFEEMHLCTEIQGDLTLKGRNFEKSDVSLFQVKHLNGCLIVEDTDFWDLDFLTRKHPAFNNQSTAIHCVGGNRFKNNPHLCPLRYEGVDGIGNLAALSKNSTNSPDCQKTFCGPEMTKDCPSLYGDLIIEDDSKIKYIKNVIGIRGQLIIRNTAIKKLEFPQLQFIGSFKTPILTVTNNSKLEVLKMPKIKEFIIRTKRTAKRGTTTLVHLENNPLLADLSLFIPRGMKCYKAANAACYHDGIFPVVEKEERKETGIDVWDLLIKIGYGVAGVLLVALLVGLLVVVIRVGRYYKKRWDNRVIYRHFKRYRGYELAPLILETAPYLNKMDMDYVLGDIISYGLMTEYLIDWRYKFLGIKSAKMDYFASKYPYNKMEFYKCTYYLKIAGCFDRLYDKLKKMIEEKKKEMGTEKIYPAKPKLREYPEKFNRIHILHVGNDWEKRILTDPASSGRSIEIVRKCGTAHYSRKELKKLKELGGLPPRVTKIGTNIISQLVQVTLKDANKNEEITFDQVEMTVISQPTTLGHFSDWDSVNWFHLIYLVNRYHGVIHTDCPQHFIAINMIMATWSVLLNPRWEVNSLHLREFGEGMYKRFRALYNPLSDPIDPWIMWVNAISSYYKALIPKPHIDEENEWYNVDIFGRDGPLQMEHVLSQCRSKNPPIVYWNEPYGMKGVPWDVRKPFGEHIQVKLKGPKADFKWGEAEYFPEEPNDNVGKLVDKSQELIDDLNKMHPKLHPEKVIEENDYQIRHCWFEYTALRNNCLRSMASPEDCEPMESDQADTDPTGKKEDQADTDPTGKKEDQDKKADVERAKPPPKKSTGSGQTPWEDN